MICWPSGSALIRISVTFVSVSLLSNQLTIRLFRVVEFLSMMIEIGLGGTSARKGDGKMEFEEGGMNKVIDGG